ncbi:MAG TPA: AAC(3) family N-acetyltransferase [Anaerolineaceae bacterium]|jgi:aminoglycoside 3-N-acetyltransferase|nr:AAC(3) family N-acetyltransferase [Anaerolineaceae bacterium]
MITFRELVSGFRRLGLDRRTPVIVHASLSAFGSVHGGAETLLGALVTAFPLIMAPTFTYKTMLIPEAGPADNGLDYGSGRDVNRMAEFYHPDMPADKLMGSLPEALRLRTAAQRSNHPILSFSGIGVPELLKAQTLEEPLAPIRALAELDGWVLLLGVNHTVNTSIHEAERQAGRRQFVRWALTLQGVRECPGFPGCSLGFEKAAPELMEITHTVALGDTRVQALPLQPMIEIIVRLLHENPLALLCDLPDCDRCAATRVRGG